MVHILISRQQKKHQEGDEDDEILEDDPTAEFNMGIVSGETRDYFSFKSEPVKTSEHTLSDLQKENA